MSTAAQERIADVGPAMQKLTEKQQRYVHALFEAPKTHGSGVFAVKMAGYGKATSSRASLAQLAYQLNSDPKIQAGVAEVSQQHLTVLGPVAVRALKRVLDNPGHRDHGRALGIVMDRVAPQNSTHTVKVEHDASPALIATAAVLARINELARRAGIDPAKMPALIDARTNGK
jgi:hypothetical protein